METKIRKESWMGQLITAYEKILSPNFESSVLDEANVVVCETLGKLEQLIKKHTKP